MPTDLSLPQQVTRAAADYGAVALRIVVVLVLAYVLRLLAHRTITRVVERAVATPTVPEALRQRVVDMSPAVATERRRQRAETIGSILRSVTSAVVFGVASATVLGEVGVDLGPILASAGILGVALGFGAQNLVKDFLSGIFMILEDQYGVGDAVDLGPANGIVEAVGLRTTRVRSVDGTVWHVRNGEVLRVGNMSQGWSRALLDVSVGYGTDVDHATAVIQRVADGVWRDEAFAELVLDEPEVWGVEQFGVDGMTIRLVVKTAPLEQWKVARELRRRLKQAFAAEGIEIPLPQRSLWLRTSPDGTPAPVTDAETPPAGRSRRAAADRTAAKASRAAATKRTAGTNRTAATRTPPASPPAGGEDDTARSDSTAATKAT